MAKRITIDPVTRIEGHLRIDCKVDGGKVTDAWSSGQMWRGIELILQGRDPRDAWIFTQRICGVCTTVHALTSIRAVENALNMEVPLNAQYIRNLIIAAHGVHDHMVHFYHLAALDWVDIVSALKADPKATSKLAESLSDWDQNSVKHITAVKEKLNAFVGTGQLGIFANGYWGHKAMKLPPEVNLLAAVHFLQALDYQREINKVVSILGGKTPHIQNMAVGGVTNAINLDSQSTLTMERLFYIKTLIDSVGSFVKNAMLVDVAAVASFYPEWTTYGSGVTNYLSVPDLPMDTKGTKFAMPGGYVPGDLNKFVPITSFNDEGFKKGVQESVKHSWYEGDWTKSPFDGETKPDYKEWDENGKYSWVKSPSYNGKPAQVGPLANVLAMFASGHEPTKRYATWMLDTINMLLKDVHKSSARVGLNSLHSTIGRIGGRAIRCAVLYEECSNQWNALVANISKGDTAIYNRPEFPKGEQVGFGFHEAPRGVLSHWVRIENGLIKNYQCVVPSTWNAGPRNGADERGPYEASLMGTPVSDPDRPLEVLRTVHSFDPCLACAVHVVDKDDNEVVKVKAL